MDNDETRPPVKDISYADYGFFLSQIYSWLFPSLLDKALDFYIWFFTKREPETILTVESLEYVLAKMDQEKPGDIDSLAALVQSLTIPDGIAVREAIRRRLSHLDGRTDKRQIARNDVAQAVRECMLSLADAMRRSEERTDADGSTTNRPQ